MNQLFTLAHIYRRPFGIFYLPEPPTDFNTKLKDFRRIAGIEEIDHSTELTFQIRRALHRREIALELYRQLEHTEPPSFSLSASLTDNSEELGEKVRKHLGINYDTQRHWGQPSIALRAWRDAFEKASVLVFQAQGVELSEMRGFSIGERPFPVVVTNSRDANTARVFTMLHELAHIMIGDAGLCDLYDRGHSYKRRVELFCNQVAASALMPKENLLAEDIIAARSGRPEWPNNELKTVANRYCVSREALILRLVTLGRAKQAFYNTKKIELEKEYEEFRNKQKESEGGPAYCIRALAREGRFYTRLVLSSYSAERITASDVSDFLDIKLKHLPDITSEIYESSS